MSEEIKKQINFLKELHELFVKYEVESIEADDNRNGMVEAIDINFATNYITFESSGFIFQKNLLEKIEELKNDTRK